jgi:hypothetical protein
LLPAPDKENFATDDISSSGDGPTSDIGAASMPIPTVAYDDPAPVAPLSRSSQPVRTLDPGAARSIASMAWKCERVGSGCPTE